MYIFINLIVFILFLNCINTLLELNLYKKKLYIYNSLIINNRFHQIIIQLNRVIHKNNLIFLINLKIEIIEIIRIQKYSE